MKTVARKPARNMSRFKASVPLHSFKICPLLTLFAVQKHSIIERHVKKNENWMVWLQGRELMGLKLIPNLYGRKQLD